MCENIRHKMIRTYSFVLIYICFYWPNLLQYTMTSSDSEAEINRQSSLMKLHNGRKGLERSKNLTPNSESQNAGNTTNQNEQACKAPECHRTWN